MNHEHFKISKASSQIFSLPLSHLAWLAAFFAVNGFQWLRWCEQQKGGSHPFAEFHGAFFIGNSRWWNLSAWLRWQFQQKCLSTECVYFKMANEHQINTSNVVLIVKSHSEFNERRKLQNLECNVHLRQAAIRNWNWRAHPFGFWNEIWDYLHFVLVLISLLLRLHCVKILECKQHIIKFGNEFISN